MPSWLPMDTEFKQSIIETNSNTVANTEHTTDDVHANDYPRQCSD
jgi:hypothetical protein